MQTLTIVADRSTGLVYESPVIWNDAAYALEQRRSEFRLLTDETRAVRTPDGCTVGENAAWLMPGEYVQWDGPLAVIG